MKFIGDKNKEYYVDKFEDVYTITSYPINDEGDIVFEGEFLSEHDAREYLLNAGCSDAAYFTLVELE